MSNRFHAPPYTPALNIGKCVEAGVIPPAAGGDSLYEPEF